MVAVTGMVIAGAATGVVAVVRQRKFVRQRKRSGSAAEEPSVQRGFEARAPRARVRSASPTTSFRQVHCSMSRDSSHSRARSSSPTGTGRALTWKESAGRIHGRDGYCLGDFTRGQVRLLLARPEDDSAYRDTAHAHGDADVVPADPILTVGASRDVTQDFKALQLQQRLQREQSLAEVPKRKDFRDAVSGRRRAEFQNLLTEGALEAGARQHPQRSALCSGSAACGKSLSCRRRPIADFFFGRDDSTGRFCHICRQWFCQSCRPVELELEPHSVALLVSDAPLSGLGPIKCCVECHRLVAMLRWQHESASGSGLTVVQKELTAAYRGLHEHQANFFEALNVFEQHLRDAEELEDAVEIIKENWREAESAQKYFDFARQVLSDVQASSPFDLIVKTGIEKRHQVLREASTRRLHDMERDAQRFLERNGRGR